MKQATAPPVNAPLYPELPAGPAETQSVNNTPPDQYFRLQEISRLRNHLEDEKDKRSQLYKKYRRGINAVDAADTALISASMGMGIGGVGLLTTVIAAPVVLGLEIAAYGCGLLGVAGKFIGRRLSVKAKKHDEVRVLAESKLNTIADHVSRALTDGQISDEEFRLIIDEAQKYTQMKAEIRTGAQKAHAAVTLDEETSLGCKAGSGCPLCRPQLSQFYGCRRPRCPAGRLPPVPRITSECPTCFAPGRSSWCSIGCRFCWLWFSCGVGPARTRQPGGPHTGSWSVLRDQAGSPCRTLTQCCQWSRMPQRRLSPQPRGSSRWRWVRTQGGLPGLTDRRACGSRAVRNRVVRGIGCRKQPRSQRLQFQSHPCFQPQRGSG